MPSKINAEFNKLRGTLSKTGKIYNQSIAELRDGLTDAETSILELESDSIDQSKIGRKALDTAKTALNNSNHSVKTNEAASIGTLTLNRIIQPASDRGIQIRDDSGDGKVFFCVDSYAGIRVDVIGEYSNNSGVTLDEVVCKDGEVDGRDVATDGTKLDTVETNADVTDTTNVRSSGAVMILEKWINYSNWFNPQTIGTIPNHAYVLDTEIFVHEAFNAGDANYIKIGYQSNWDVFGLNTDVSTTGIKSPAAGSDMGYNSTGRTVKAYLGGAGTMPSAGWALVILKYMLATSRT